MNIFKTLTPATYWVLIALWAFILFFYLKRLRRDRLKGSLLFTLLLILSIDAFRTLFESFYFGAWYTSLAGFLPIEVHSFLVRPEMVFIPKILNVIAAIAVIFLLLLKWLPEETQEKDRLEQLVESKTKGLEKEIENRKQVEAEINIHINSLNTIFNSTPNILILVNEERRVEDINHKGAEFAGKTKKDLLGLLGGEVFGCVNSFDGEGCGLNPACAECPIRTRVVDTFDTGRPHVEEEGQMTFLLSGEKTSLNLLISTSLLNLNKTKNVLLSITDITDLKQTQEALIQNENKYRTLFEDMAQGVFYQQANGELIDVNPSALKMFSLTRDQFLGKTSTHPSWKIIREDGSDLPGEIHPSIEALRTGKSVDNKIAGIYHPQKENFVWVNINAKPQFRDGEEKPYQVYVTMHDITALKKSQDALKKSEETSQALLNAFIDSAFLMEIDGTVITMNDVTANRLGKHKDEVVGKCVYDFLPPQVAKSRKKRIENVIQTGEQVRFMDERSGMFIDQSIFPLFDSQGKVNQLAVFARDITKERQLEARLLQAQKMESIGNLAGGIAHDFNNLLFPILGISEMLLEDLPADSLEYENVQEIFDAGQRGSELVKQILAFSRQHDHKLIPVRVQQVLKEVLKLSRSTIPKNIEISQHLQQDCGLVMADSTQLHQIGMNLITNAYHAVEEIEGEIDVQVREIILSSNESTDLSLKSGKYVMLSVNDNGAGIAKENLDKIFEPYFTTKKQDKGTGLGLSVVFGIVKEHKGDIKVVSEVGKGTTCLVYLPLMDKTTKSLPTQQSVNLPTGTERILLVDDEIPIARLEKQMLERLGYTVTERTSSSDALEAFRSNLASFDLVISDMSMPQMTGIQLAGKIR